jgi:excinuclease ABC subunit C
VEEVMAVPGVGRRTAEAVVDALAARGPKPVAVNMTTGEILDEPTPEPTPTTPAAPEREDT